MTDEEVLRRIDKHAYDQQQRYEGHVQEQVVAVVHIVLLSTD